ncbi:hypothetical protein Emed_001674 [Eimeria media]
MSDVESQRVLGAGIPRTGRLIDVAHLSGLQHMGLDKEIKYGKKNFLILYFASGLVGSILAETLMVWHKLDERTRNMYTLDITVFAALMILLSYGQTVTCEFNKNIRDLPG